MAPASDTPGILSPTIKIDGTELSTNDVDAIKEARFERELNVPARASICFRVDQLGPKGSSLDLTPAWDLEKRFTVGSQLEASVVDATSGASSVVFKGEITAIDWLIRSGAPPEVVVVAHDASYRLGRQVTVRTFAEVSLVEALNTIMADVSLRCSATGLPALQEPNPYLLQQSTGLTFLNDVVERFGACWQLDTATSAVAVFPWGTAQGPAVTVDASTDLRDLSVRATTRADEVKVTDFDVGTVASVVGTAASSPLSTGSDLQSATEASKLGKLSLLASDVAAQSKSEADALAAGVRVQATAGTLLVRGEAELPLSGLEPGGGVKITHGGPADGTYFLTRVEHRFRQSDGLRTRFVAGDRTPSGLADLLSPARVPTSLGPHETLVLGMVTNIRDPEEQYRVKVKFPGLSGADESAWAPVVAPGAGKERGVAFFPEVNDVVVVGFERGDTRRPFVLGGVYTTKEKSLPVAASTGKVQKRYLSSRLGHVVEFGDGEGPDQEYVQVQLAGKQHTLRVAKDKVLLDVPQSVPVTLQAGTASIALSDGNVTIKGMEVTVEGTTKVTVKAPEVAVKAETTAEVSGAVEAKLTGSMATVQASGIAAVKGAAVQIN